MVIWSLFYFVEINQNLFPTYFLGSSVGSYHLDNWTTNVNFRFCLVGCGGKPADILFLLHCSSSIWGPNFKKQLQFVRNVVDEFDVTPSRTRIGVMTYGSYVSEEIALGQYVSKESLSNTINSIRQMRGDTRTDKALDRVGWLSTFHILSENEKPACFTLTEDT